MLFCIPIALRGKAFIGTEILSVHFYKSFLRLGFGALGPVCIELIPLQIRDSVLGQELRIQYSKKHYVSNSTSIDHQIRENGSD